MAEDQMTFKISFLNPRHLSHGERDTLIVQFFDTESYLVPLASDHKSLPEGFSVPVTVSPQGSAQDGTLDQDEVESMQATGQLMVVFMFVACFFRSFLLA